MWWMICMHTWPHASLGGRSKVVPLEAPTFLPTALNPPSPTLHLQVRIHDHTLEAALILFKTFSTDQDEADQTVFQEDLYVSR